MKDLTTGIDVLLVEDSREHGGTGLGLSICKSLVELMGGRIGFANNDDAGCTFWFEIELPTVHKADVKPQLCADPGDRTAARILLVEDLPMNQELACTILRRAGHFVEIANDGIEAVSAAEENSYDIILMDIQMPRMDGVSAARKIRQLDGPGRNTPIIAMTANALPEQVRAFRQAGMDDYVAKPFKQQDLHDAIRRVMDPLATMDVALPRPALDAHLGGESSGISACR
ncbi:MAG TPA: response regulator [Sphingomicrobium sp.]